MNTYRRFRISNFDCLLPPDVRDELLGRKRKRAGGVPAPKPVRSGLVAIGSWLAFVLLVAAIAIGGGFKGSWYEPVTNKRVSLSPVQTIRRAELVSLPAPRAELVRLPAPRAELVRLRP